jgi:hypothetical protein
MRLHRRQRCCGVTPPDPGGERRLLGPPLDNSTGMPRPATARMTGAPVDRSQLGRVAAVGLGWPLPAEMTDAALEAELFTNVGTKQGHRRQVGLGEDPPRAEAQAHHAVATVGRVHRIIRLSATRKNAANRSRSSGRSSARPGGCRRSRSAAKPLNNPNNFSQKYSLTFSGLLLRHEIN